jgi:hypothetical protein
MKRATYIVAMFFLLLAAGGALFAQQSPSAEAERVRQRLIGSYRLVSWTQYDVNGQTSLSPYTSGQISYDAAGRMAAHLMTDERRKLAAQGGRGAAGPGGQGSDFAGYISYYGRYEIDAARSIVTHHVEGSTNLGMIGTGQVRYYELTPDGRTLFLSTKNGERVTGRLQWDRY